MQTLRRLSLPLVHARWPRGLYAFMVGVLAKVLLRANLHYGSSAEDVQINSRFPTGVGFYVDVGCYDPVRSSNTYKLYERGWHGIVIDANKHMIERFRRQRPRDIAVCALVSADPAPIEFVELGRSDVSSASRNHVNYWKKHSEVSRTTTMHPRSLTDILVENNAPTRFEVLDVDCEGLDLEVLQSLDFDRFQPQLIIAELLGARTVSKALSSDISVWLDSKGYDMVQVVGLNGFYLRRSSSA